MYPAKLVCCCGVTADDMGLGKTLTMISLVLAHKQPATEDSHWHSKREQVKKCQCTGHLNVPHYDFR